VIVVDNDYRRTECPLCGGRLETIGAIRKAGPTSFSTHEIRLARAPELGRCARCASAFTQNAIRPEEALDLYATGAGTERWTSAAFEELKTDEAVAVLSRVVAPGVRLLDIGCNTGELLDFARARGAHTAGVEPSHGGRRAAAAKGHATWASLDEAEGPFDVVTAFDVVEHVYDPRRLVNEVRERLAPGGKFVVLTGDVLCRDAWKKGAAWWYVSYPEHVVFPSVDALARVAQLRVAEVVKTYADRSHQRLPLRRLKRLLPMWNEQAAYDHVVAVLARAP
jgi:SAM-dependent methyltransferase